MCVNSAPSCRCIWSPLICGATLVLPDNEETRLYPDVLLRFFANRHLTHAFVLTVLVHDLVSQPQPDGLALRYLFTAGEKLNPVNLSRLNCPLFDYYGPTEATIFTTGNTVICSSQNPQPSIGLPVAGAEVYILDEQLQRVTDGEEGELFIGGPGLALGYLNDPALTREKFFAAPFAPDTRLYRSGDRARRLPDGRIQYLGRLDDQIKIRGNRVELGEIASVLTQVEGVKGAIALLLPATLTREQRILAFVAAESQTPDDLLATLRAHLLETLPTYFMPAAIRIVPRLPLTSNGKVDKTALLTHYLSTPDVASPAQEAPLNEREALLADIWHKALDGATPAFNEHFLDLGGHSLIAARMAVTITERMGVRTYVRDIYDYPTIRLLANALEIRSQSAPLRSDSEPLRILQDDVFLPDDLIIDPHYDERQLTAPRRILLTGATGFVGSQLLADLLRDTDAEVYCLIRADSTEAAAQRLLATLAGFCITLSDEQSKRAIPLVGDISKAQLGLAPDDYTRLCQEVDVIYHSAGAVNYIQPYSFMKHHTVHGIREIVSFAAHSRTKPLILLSSIAIYSWKPLNSDRWMVYEDDDIDLNLPEVITDIGYVRSKWVMEKIANLAAERGLPLMVFRLGYATTHSQTGVSADYQWWANMVRICVKTGIIPTLQEFREGFTTVDYISNAIVHIGRQPRAIGQRFNLVPEPANNLSHSDFFHLLEKHFGFRFQRQPLHEWLAHWEDDPHSPLYPLLSLFKDNMTDGQSTVELYEDTYQWDNRNLRRFLQGSDIQEPRFTRELLANYLRRTIGYSDIAPAVSPPRRQ